jgi:hypothetical protein
MAGVAFSRNLYAWSSRIDPQRGIIRLVFGLGTRAVDRVGGDYPRMIAISNPALRPEVGRKVALYSQKHVDLLDLEANGLVTLPVTRLLGDASYPDLQYLVSVQAGELITEPIGRPSAEEAGRLVLTFNNLLKKSDLVEKMEVILETLEEAYGRPVDIEFTAHLDQGGLSHINLLQCRPLFIPGSTEAVMLPEDLPAERVLFEAGTMINGGVVRDVGYIVYIDPRGYSELSELDDKRSIGRVVGQLDDLEQLREGRIMMMGPGRWGSSNIDLGVNVSYADIDNAAVLVEMAREEAGHVPEVSYGTHFFNDLVEAGIIFLPVFPDDRESRFNTEFFESSPNSLAAFMPRAERFSGVIKLIDVAAATGGRLAQVVADPRSQRAVCYLA